MKEPPNANWIKYIEIGKNPRFGITPWYIPRASVSDPIPARRRLVVDRKTGAYQIVFHDE